MFTARTSVRLYVNRRYTPADLWHAIWLKAYAPATLSVSDPPAGASI